MADNQSEDVRVKLGADNAGLDAGLTQTVNALKTAVDTMIAQLASLNDASKENAETIKKSNNEITTAFDDMQAQIQGVHATISSIFTKLTAGIASFMAVLAGGAAFRKFISDSNEFSSSVMKLATTMGITSDRATTLVAALNDVGGDVDSFSQTFLKFERRVRTNSDAMKAYGVDIDSLKNGTKSGEQVFREAIQTIGKYKQGHDQLQVSMEILGTRGFGDLQKMMKLTNEKMAEAEIKQRALGLTVTQENVKMTRAYKESMNDAAEVFQGISKVIATAVMPGLTRLGEWFDSVGPQAVSITQKVMDAFITVMGTVQKTALSMLSTLQMVFSTMHSSAKEHVGEKGAAGELSMFTNVLKVIEITAVFVSAGVQQAFKLIAGAVGEGIIAFKALAGILAALATKNFSSVISIGNAYTREAKGMLKQTLADIKEIGNSAKKQMDEIAMRGAAAKGTDIAPKGTLSAPERPKKSTGHDERMSQYRDELLQEQQLRGYFNEMSKKEEADFWRAKLELVSGNSKADQRLRREINRMIYADDKAFYREEQALGVQRLQNQIADAHFNLEEQVRVAHTLSEFQKATWGENSRQYEAAIRNETQIKRNQVAEMERLEKQRSDFELRNALYTVNQKEEAAKFEVDMYRINAQQLFAFQVDLENQKSALTKATLQKEYDAIIVGVNAVQATKDAAYQKLVDAAQSHEAKVLQIRRDAIKEAAKYELDAINGTKSALQGFLESLTDGTKTLKDKLLSLGKSLEQVVTRVAANKLTEDALGAGTSGGNFLSNIFGKMFGTAGAAGASSGATAANAALTTLSTTAVTTDLSLTTLDVTTVALDVSLAALTAAATAASAALMTVGVSSAASSAGTMAAAAAVMLDDGTNYVPRDMLAVVHKGEAVVPAEFNKKGMAVGGLTMHNQFLISGPIDTRSQDQIVLALQRAASRTSYRNG